MDESIYEVERNDYAGVLRQINPKTTEVREYQTDNAKVLEIKTKRGTLLTRRVIPQEGVERYYVFELPQGPNWIQPKPVMRVTLETKEEVQHFFDALSQLQKGENK